ncbi:MAG: ribosome assembly RNA-binding protein YhbY [Lachnospiraceae bacterium]|nr:ribosome assembly RNA-binding protein YhbY [Lachnospiraceae bacterium]
MTSKQRAYLKSLAMNIEPSVRVGKDTLTDGVLDAVRDAIEAHELIKIGVLKNCADDPAELARMIAVPMGAEIVQVIGKKIVLYRQAKKKEDRKIVLPR